MRATGFWLYEYIAVLLVTIAVLKARQQPSGIFHCVVPFDVTASFNDIVNNFVKSSPNPCGPTRLVSGWIAKSKTSCAFNCMTRFGQECRGFMYNKVTRLCTPSSGLSGNFPIPSGSEGELYLMRSPDIYPDFSIHSQAFIVFGGASANVAYYTNKVNYTDAAAVCRCLDSHLYIADSTYKYDLISGVVSPTDSVWIGLDDMANEGVFVWSGSGQQLDMGSFLKSYIFDWLQPDDGRGNEDCVNEKRSLGRLNDAPCSLTLSYLCEKT